MEQHTSDEERRAAIIQESPFLRAFLEADFSKKGSRGNDNATIALAFNNIAREWENKIGESWERVLIPPLYAAVKALDIFREEDYAIVMKYVKMLVAIGYDIRRTENIRYVLNDVLDRFNTHHEFNPELVRSQQGKRKISQVFFGLFSAGIYLHTLPTPTNQSSLRSAYPHVPDPAEELNLLSKGPFGRYINRLDLSGLPPPPTTTQK